MREWARWRNEEGSVWKKGGENEETNKGKQRDNRHMDQFLTEVLLCLNQESQAVESSLAFPFIPMAFVLYAAIFTYG